MSSSTNHLRLAAARLTRRALLCSLTIAAGLLAPPACAQSLGDSRTATAPITNADFGALVGRLSEPGGYFDTDNLISNEGSYLHVMGGLRAHAVRGGAFLGVGPDQNFSYIAEIQPTLAILVDIRRDNLLEHLLFKALFELSTSRAEYLSLLLARPLPANLNTDIEAIAARLDAQPMSAAAYEETQRRVVERIGLYGVRIDSADWATIDRFHRAFASAGLGLKFESFGRAPQSYYPDLRQLILERDLDGRRASFLATEEAFQRVRTLQLQNRIIPVVGDLAGEIALSNVASFLRERREVVSAYYVSNADFYIVRDGKLERFMANIKALPTGTGSVIIRSVFRTGFGGANVPSPVAGYRSAQSLQSLPGIVAEYDAGRIGGYGDLIGTALLTTATR